MKQVRAALYGAIAGSVIAMVLTALFVGRFAVNALDVLDGRAAFEASTGSVYLLVVVVGLIGGLAISAVTYAIGAESEPETHRFPVTWMLPIGAVVAALFAYAVLRFGVGLVGDISGGVITISVVWMAVIALEMGIVAGAVTGVVVDALARPSTIRFEGEAAPESTRAMMAEMLAAIGAPIIALIAGAVFAIALSQVLLAVEGVGAVIIFSVVGAVVLGGATLIALAPWDRENAA